MLFFGGALHATANRCPKAPRKALLHFESRGRNTPAPPTKAIACLSRGPWGILAPGPSGAIFERGSARDSLMVPRVPSQSIAPFRVPRMKRTRTPRQGYSPPVPGPRGISAPGSSGTIFGRGSKRNYPWVPRGPLQCHAPFQGHADKTRRGPHYGYNPLVSGP